MRVVPLSTSNGGMTRLRNKGGARPDTLYDCLNAYITLAGTIRPRPGTLDDITLPANTVGLVAHKCKFTVFSHEPGTTSNPDKYVIAALRHPSNPATPLAQIHFAAPFMGFLYVAAEFTDGQIWHYWLEELDAWSGSTDYFIGDRVFPGTENGFAYKATRASSPFEAWAPNVEREVGDVIEPVSYNGFKYEVIGTTGDNPASGANEPDWPTESGAQIVEYTQGGADTSITTPILTPDPDLGSIPPEWRNIAGGFVLGSFTR